MGSWRASVRNCGAKIENSKKVSERYSAYQSQVPRNPLFCWAGAEINYSHRSKACSDPHRTSTSRMVLTEDLWSALDALHAVPESKQTEWYKRLEEAADAATQAMLLEKGVIREQ